MANARPGRFAHRAVRIAQTPRAFRNWATVLWAMAGGRRAAESLEFVTRDGLRVSCPNVPGARVPIYEVFAENAYHLDTFLGSMSGEALNVVDIGGHVGAFACQLAALAPEARIRCYEPSPVSAQYLRRNVDANRIGDRVTVHEAAVAARVGQSVLADNGGGSALNSLVEDGVGVTVDTTTFDAIAAEDGPVDVVKIDCEGGEYDLVFGSSPANWAGVRRVVLEYHPSSQHSWPDLRSWFAEQGLVVVREQAENSQQGTAWLARQA